MRAKVLCLFFVIISSCLHLEFQFPKINFSWNCHYLMLLPLTFGQIAKTQTLVNGTTDAIVVAL